MRRLRAFIASPFWGIGIVLGTISAVFMAIGDVISGKLKIED